MGPQLKNFTKTLISFQKIALDSSCFIYHIEKNSKYLELTRIIFKELLPEGSIKATSSTLILTEILTKPYKLNRPRLALTYKTLIKTIPNFSLISPDEQIADTAAQIRAKYGLRTPAAIHLATAVDQNVGAIIGNDLRWKQVKEITTITLDEFI